MNNLALDHIIPFFNRFDVAALVLLYASWLIIGWVIETPPKSKPSVSVLMQTYRHRWMHQVITREPRVFDATILSNLRQGTAFFASTSMIAIGGGLALMGNVDRLTTLANEISLEETTNLLWELKLLIIIFFVSNAFLKFVWAHRVFGYCAVVLGAMPNDPTDPRAELRASEAGHLNNSAAKAYNRGLRSVYFALASLAWLLGAIPLIIATLFTVAVLWRREFSSATRSVLVQNNLDI